MPIMTRIFLLLIFFPVSSIASEYELNSNSTGDFLVKLESCTALSAKATNLEEVLFVTGMKLSLPRAYTVKVIGGYKNDKVSSYYEGSSGESLIVVSYYYAEPTATYSELFSLTGVGVLNSGFQDKMSLLYSAG